MKHDAKQLARMLFELTKDEKRGDLDQIVSVFVEHLNEQRMRSHWREIVRMFDGIWREQFGAANVELRSAHALPTAIREKIEKAFPGASIVETVDTSLLGGLSVRVDDRIVDGTLSTKLETLKHQLA